VVDTWAKGARHKGGDGHRKKSGKIETREVATRRTDKTKREGANPKAKVLQGIKKEHKGEGKGEKSTPERGTGKQSADKAAR